MKVAHSPLGYVWNIPKRKKPKSDNKKANYYIKHYTETIAKGWDFDIEMIINVISEYYDLTFGWERIRTSKRFLCECRFLIYYIAVDIKGVSQNYVATYFNYDHSTINNGRTVIKHNLHNTDYAKIIDCFTLKVSNSTPLETK